MSVPWIRCEADELRTLFLFEKLTDDQLACLCRDGRVEWFDAGPVYREGEPATCFYVLFEGTVVLSRRVGGEDVDVNRTSMRGVYAGAFQAYLGDQVPQVYNNSMRVTERSRFFILPAETFAGIMHEWFPLAVHLLEGLFFGTKSTQQAIGQRERLLALGSLTAGLTHELNNPAAAAVRAAAELRERVAAMRHKLGVIAADPLRRDYVDALAKFQDEAAELASHAPSLSPLEASDREDAAADWLDDRGVEDGWRMAPAFVQAGVGTEWLDRVADALPADVLGPALRWLDSTVETELLLSEIEDATRRISALVDAAKSYAQLDRAPYRQVDVHDLLDSTLVMLAKKIGPDVRVVKEYDRDLPDIPAYPSELNQVWTNLIDNALGAMAGPGAGAGGTLTLRTYRDDGHLIVEVADTGPGVPAEIRDRIFDPFFTTKAVGEGTGLGLDISWRIVVGKHGGDLTVQSEPGDTRFRVRLPLDGAESAPVPEPASPVPELAPEPEPGSEPASAPAPASEPEFAPDFVPEPGTPEERP
ncbi:ATP-binding protein [Yinghuangia soli]|uniref:histidine kinase n=1 Tax=Yinghuangia soli TaxID=2908204 RepID=A0AA41QAP1_9ACTN|nr:ATP-binding protein [Yinghuangia soli]MCF2533307.1 ATP-binding protein [Yinghuangia soli]